MPRIASESLAEWAGGAQALALLRGALDAGVLSALREPCDVAQLAVVPDRSADWLLAVCRALEVHGIVEQAGPGWVLSAPFARLCAEDAQRPLPDFLVSVDARVDRPVEPDVLFLSEPRTRVARAPSRASPRWPALAADFSSRPAGARPATRAASGRGARPASSESASRECDRAQAAHELCGLDAAARASKTRVFARVGGEPAAA